jgi:hypothetical protein
LPRTDPAHTTSHNLCSARTDRQHRSNGRRERVEVGRKEEQRDTVRNVLALSAAASAAAQENERNMLLMRAVRHAARTLEPPPCSAAPAPQL